MKKNFTHLFTILICFLINACSGVTPMDMTSSPSVTNTPLSTIIILPSPTSGIPEVPALVKTSLEFYRNGKAYEIVVGYAIGNAFFYATPHAEIPERVFSDVGVNSADLKRYGDFDKDGEREFIVSIMSCGAYCSETIRMYDYDAKGDKYFVADEFGAKYPAVDEYNDINDDGNPELTTVTYGFCYNCSTASAGLSALAILRYEYGKFMDVSTEFPELIQKDADLDLKSAKANEQDAADIMLPAYLYNMYRLGRIEEARPIFDQVCASVIKPNRSSPSYNFDCAQFRTDVEKYISEFKLRQ